MIEHLSSIRDATLADRLNIAHLTHFSPYIHLHADWRAPLEWLGQEPFLVFLHRGQPAGALACPPDPPGMAWLRLFVCQGNPPPEVVWAALWPEARSRLSTGTQVAVIGMHPWLQRLLENSGFQAATRVVLLQWTPHSYTDPPRLPSGFTLRPMTADDLPQVEQIDRLAFNPLWHYSRDTLREALLQAALAMVVEGPQGLAGFQISTASPFGAHLARLAVHPAAQGQGLGKALVQHLMQHVAAQGALQLTVNTQETNSVSLHLYQRLGFRRTGNVYPVYLYTIA